MEAERREGEDNAWLGVGVGVKVWVWVRVRGLGLGSGSGLGLDIRGGLGSRVRATAAADCQHVHDPLGDAVEGVRRDAGDDHHLRLDETGGGMDEVGCSSLEMGWDEMKRVGLA